MIFKVRNVAFILKKVNFLFTFSPFVRTVLLSVCRLTDLIATCSIPNIRAYTTHSRDQPDSRSRPFSWFRSRSRKYTFSLSRSQSLIFMNKSLGLACWDCISSVSVSLVETVPARSWSRTLKTGLADLCRNTILEKNKTLCRSWWSRIRWDRPNLPQFWA